MNFVNSSNLVSIKRQSDRNFISKEENHRWYIGTTWLKILDEDNRVVRKFRIKSIQFASIGEKVVFNPFK
jgi:hypothetical protein